MSIGSDFDIIDIETLAVEQIVEGAQEEMIDDMRRYRTVIQNEFNGSVIPSFLGFMALFFPENTKIKHNERFSGIENPWEINWNESATLVNLFSPTQIYKKYKIRKNRVREYIVERNATHSTFILFRRIHWKLIWVRDNSI